MKKTALYLGLALLVTIIVVIGLAFTKPKEYRVERSVTTTAPADRVYSVFSDFHRFAEWSPWQKLDPAMSTSFAGPALGVGSTYRWKGNSKVGSGEMLITDTKPNEAVTIALTFLEPFPSESQTIWRVKEENGQRKISWIMQGSNESLAARVFSVFIDMDKIIGKDFENGLESLKAVSEHDSAADK